MQTPTSADTSPDYQKKKEIKNQKLPLTQKKQDSEKLETTNKFRQLEKTETEQRLTAST